jgi:hypothetical protein
MRRVILGRSRKNSVFLNSGGQYHAPRVFQSSPVKRKSMMSPRESEMTRRLLLASVGGLTSVVLVHPTVADDKDESDSYDVFRKISDVRKEFERLLPLWQEERKKTRPGGKTNAYWTGPHGRAIIALGPGIIPYLIQQVKSGDIFFNVPLRLITKIDIGGESHEHRSKLWVEWWEAGKNTPME